VNFVERIATELRLDLDPILGCTRTLAHLIDPTSSPAVFWKAYRSASSCRSQEVQPVGGSCRPQS
jgi:hypothetical protein